MKNVSYMIVLAAVSLTFTSCNTFIGFGRDVQSLGSGIENRGNQTVTPPTTTQGVAQPNPYGVPAAR